MKNVVGVTVTSRVKVRDCRERVLRRGYSLGRGRVRIRDRVGFGASGLGMVCTGQKIYGWDCV